MSKKEAALGWQTMIDHINETWKKAKRADYGYPFTGRDFKQLRGFVEIFQSWGIMALWDCYLVAAESNDFLKSRGYSVELFVSSLPWLTDKAWKGVAAGYEKQIAPAIPKEIETLLFQIAPERREKPRRRTWRR